MRLILPELLKEVRGGLSIQELSRRSGVSKATLYNAEAGDPVSWAKIEKGYGDLCEGGVRIETLLAAWAVGQASEVVEAEMLEEEIHRLKEGGRGRVVSGVEGLDGDLAKMSGPDREVFLEFAKKYAEGRSARDLVRAWLAAVAE